MTAGAGSSNESRRRAVSAETDLIDLIDLHPKPADANELRGIWTPVEPRYHRVYQERRRYHNASAGEYEQIMGGGNDGEMTQKNKPKLSIDTSAKYDDEERGETPATATSTPRTPANVRGSSDVRSPGEEKTPVAQEAKLNHDQALPDFITQTDANGNATTPRSSQAIQGASKSHPSGRKPGFHAGKKGQPTQGGDDDNSHSSECNEEDPCETLLENLRMMCCCMDEHHVKLEAVKTEESDGPVKLLGNIHPDDAGKMCLVLDLDETLVHSSFRPVADSDFVIPVEIEDVTHLVYVAKRPGVDEFLVEMAKYYEIVIYTASLNKYADPLLDMLDPKKVIRTRLFRESCVYYEGNYVKDLSLLNRDLTKTIIIDNSPASYMFHPENAIDCSSFIDDRGDRELDQIGAFLADIKNTDDVRGLCNRWKDWPAAVHEA